MTDQLLPFAEPLHPQPVLTPSQRDFATEEGRRATNAERCLQRLQAGQATGDQLEAVGGRRFSARLGELRARGIRIETERLSASQFVYRLVE